MSLYTTLPIFAPAPQRPAADFATVLGWREPEDNLCGEDQSVKQDSPNISNYTGASTQALPTEHRWVAQRRATARYGAIGEPALVNQAPPWPPAPELIANPPSWGLPTHSSVAPPLSVAAHADWDATDSRSSWSDTPTSSLSGIASQWFDDEDEDLSWDTRSSSVEAGEGDKDISAEDATRFFIGRDGTAWPLPPPEFMPVEDILSPEPLDSTERSSFSSECDWSRPGYRVVWSASQWDEGSAEVEHTPSTDFTDASFSDSDDGASSPCPPYHHSPSSESLDWSPATPPDLPSMALPLAELGLQWYASFGRDIDDPASCSSKDGPLSDDTGDKDADDWEAGGYFLGRDGTLWPLPPPPPPVLAPPKIERGRKRLPKVLSEG
ncbi:hypothetical protein FKP32DRAFT_1676241 [Trametes sanguinea]|nr:hypothetical protein FKP32DRAFT_1676241 [Trametes sanguinea]